MTSREKAKATRQKNREAWERRYREERELKDLMKHTLQEVLESEKATIQQKMEAIAILYVMIY